jgi:hypothetical protein
MLNEHDGKTTVSVFMQHAARAEGEEVQQALAPWREIVEKDAQRKWREDFIRTFKRVVYHGR